MATSMSSSGYPETLTVTVHSAAQRLAVEKALAMSQELEAITEAAVPGQVFDCCEDAAVIRGQEFTRALLEQTLQQSVERQEKKEPCGSVLVAGLAVRTKGRKPRKP